MDELKRLSDGGNQVVHQRGVYQRGPERAGRGVARPGRPRRPLPSRSDAREPTVMRYTEATVTTSSNRDGSRRKTRGSASRPASSKKTGRKTAERPRRVAVAVEPAPEPVAPELPAVVVDEPEPYPFPLPVSSVETTFAARMPAPEPERPRPPGRRAIFLDVENTSRAQHLAHVIDHLGVDPWDRRTELVAVANWRVVGHEAARLLAARGAHLVHSAPSTGVRDWSDLRIAVAAGIWLAAARPGDVIEVVSDDRAFDAVGDVAASLGIEFRRLSYRRIKEGSSDTAVETETGPPAESAAGSRRRRRRRGRGPGGPPPSSGDRRHVDSREAPRHPPQGGHARRAGGRRARAAGALAPRRAAAPGTGPDHRTPRRAGFGGARARRGVAPARGQHRLGGERAQVQGIPAVARIAPPRHATSPNPRDRRESVRDDHARGRCPADREPAATRGRAAGGEQAHADRGRADGGERADRRVRRRRPPAGLPDPPRPRDGAARGGRQPRGAAVHAAKAAART